jgi:hypothetical protein
LATLGEIGLPISQQLHLRDGEATVGELVTSAMTRFHAEQLENEWSAIAYARYVFPTLAWTNQYGERRDVEDLVAELVERRLGEGACRGTHRLEALVVLYRANETARALPPRVEQRIESHLGEVAALLVRTQHAEGYWDGNWARNKSAASDDASLAVRILSTGHHLEWLALAPEHVQPPRETVVRAAQWLVRAMLEVDDVTLQRQYGPFSHAARALCLWRSREPIEAWKKSAISGVVATEAKHQN